MSNQPIIFYSPYGYIKILKEEYENKTKINLNFTSINGLSGVISRNNLKTEIEIKLKCFHGERETYSFKISIYNKISEILEKLFEIESNKNIPVEKRWLRVKQYRLISTRIKIHDLNSFATLSEEKIIEGETLIILPINKLNFSETMKGRNIVLTKTTNIICKINSDEPQYALGDLPLKLGKNYFEIILLTDPIEKSVIVGVCTKRDPNNLNVTDIKSFYGFILSEAKKISSVNGRTEQDNFGEKASIKDRVGVMVEFLGDGAKIDFFKNKVFIGTAFSKINEKIFFPCVALGLTGTKIMMTNQVDFP